MKRARKFKRRERKLSRPYVIRVDGVYVRCRCCLARRTLTRSLRSSTRLPRCRDCGARDYRVDTYRQRHERGARAPRPCSCPEYHFPHRRGSGMCQWNPNVTEEYARARGRA